MKRFEAVLMVVGSLISGFAMAQRQGGFSGGGGYGVVVNDSTRIADVVDPTVCRWYSGEKFQKQFVPEFPTFIKNLDKIHPYMAFVIERELTKVQVCVVPGDLKMLPREDTDKYTIWKNAVRIQVAIRENETVMVSQLRFAKLPKDPSLRYSDKTLSLVHELLHSFLPMYIEDRPRAMEGLVYLLGQKKYDNQDLALTLKKNSFSLPSNPSLISPAMIRDLKKVLDEKTTPLERQASNDRLAKSDFKSEYLGEADQTAKNIIEESQIQKLNELEKAYNNSPIGVLTRALPNYRFPNTGSSAPSVDKIKEFYAAAHLGYCDEIQETRPTLSGGPKKSESYSGFIVALRNARVYRSWIPVLDFFIEQGCAERAVETELAKTESELTQTASHETLIAELMAFSIHRDSEDFQWLINEVTPLKPILEKLFSGPKVAEYIVRVHRANSEAFKRWPVSTSDIDNREGRDLADFQNAVLLSNPAMNRFNRVFLGKSLYFKLAADSTFVHADVVLAVFIRDVLARQYPEAKRWSQD